mgnify:CR=1 FL=1
MSRVTVHKASGCEHTSLEELGVCCTSGCHVIPCRTAVLVARAMTVSAAIGGDIILHAYHSVGMMMVGNDGYHQHYQADEKKNIGYVLFLFHSSIFGRMQR